MKRINEREKRYLDPIPLILFVIIFSQFRQVGGAINSPTNLVANTVSSTQINLKWKDNSSNEAGFKIERKNGNGQFSQIATTNANTAYDLVRLNNRTGYQPKQEVADDRRIDQKRTCFSQRS